MKGTDDLCFPVQIQIVDFFQKYFIWKSCRKQFTIYILKTLILFVLHLKQHRNAQESPHIISVSKPCTNKCPFLRQCIVILYSLML